MKVRADIAELLRAGVKQSHICRQLHCAPLTVQRTREALHLPAPKICRILPATLEDAFRQHTQPTEGGHVAWSGPVTGGVPKVTFQGTTRSAYRVSFRIHHGREPVGRVTSSCEVQRCVSGRCVEDKPMREANQRADRAFAAIFGASA